MKQVLKPGIHWLYIFIPICYALKFMHASTPLVFFTAALAIIPVSILIGDSSESLAKFTSEAFGGFITATFANLPELIIGIVALKEGLHEMLLATMAGAIIANLLFILGISFLVCGIKFHSMEYNSASIRVYSSMMLLAIISLMVPSAFGRYMGGGATSINEFHLNTSIAVTLLLAYILYLFFMFKTHRDFFKNKKNPENEEHGKDWSLQKSIFLLLFSSTLVAFLSEVLVGAAEETGEVLGMSSVFVGVIFVALVGAAGNIPAIIMAAKGKMDLSISIVMGSAIQISLFVAPLLALLSIFVGPGQITLEFSRVLLSIMFLGVLLGAIITGDGISNWYKGVQLIIIYLIIAMMFFFVPH